MHDQYIDCGVEFSADYEMQALQKRLEETEAHMTHILEAMHSLQQQASVEPTLESQDVTGKMAAVPASDAEPTFRPGKHDSAIWSHMPRSDLYAVPKLDSKTEECADTSAGHLVQMEEDHGTEHMTDLEKDQSFKATIKLTSKPVICGESDSCSFVYRCRVSDCHLLQLIVELAWLTLNKKCVQFAELLQNSYFCSYWRSCHPKLVFPPHVVIIVAEVKATGPPHVLQLWLGVGKGILPVKYISCKKTSICVCQISRRSQHSQS